METTIVFDKYAAICAIFYAGVNVDNGRKHSYWSKHLKTGCNRLRRMRRRMRRLCFSNPTSSMVYHKMPCWANLVTNPISLVHESNHGPSGWAVDDQQQCPVEFTDNITLDWHCEFEEHSLIIPYRSYSMALSHQTAVAVYCNFWQVLQNDYSLCCLMELVKWFRALWAKS